MATAPDEAKTASVSPTATTKFLDIVTDPRLPSECATF